MHKPDKHALSILTWFRTFYGFIFFAALWATAFALTGNVLRAFLFVGAGALVWIAARALLGVQVSIHALKMVPYMEQFEKEMQAAEDLKAGDAVYKDDDGRARKS